MDLERRFIERFGKQEWEQKPERWRKALSSLPTITVRSAVRT